MFSVTRKVCRKILRCAVGIRTYVDIINTYLWNMIYDLDLSLRIQNRSKNHQRSQCSVGDQKSVETLTKSKHLMSRPSDSNKWRRLSIEPWWGGFVLLTSASDPLNPYTQMEQLFLVIGIVRSLVPPSKVGFKPTTLRSLGVQFPTAYSKAYTKFVMHTSPQVLRKIIFERLYLFRVIIYVLSR